MELDTKQLTSTANLAFAGNLLISIRLHKNINVIIARSCSKFII